MSDLPCRPSVLTSDEARRMIESLIRRHLGREVRALHWTESGASTRSTYYTITAIRENGRSFQVWAKAAAQAPRSRGAMSGSLMRELAAYELLKETQSTPRLIGSWNDSRQERAWIVLSYVDGIGLHHDATMAAWALAGQSIARIHTRGGRLLKRKASDDRLPAVDRRWRTAALKKALHTLRAVPRSVRPPIARLERRYTWAAELMGSLPTTLVHGECFAQHVLVERMRRRRALFIDWEDAAWGPAALDLEALTWGLTADRRRALLSAYAQVRKSDAGFTLDEISDEALRAAMLCNRVTYLANWAKVLTENNVLSIAGELREALAQSGSP